MIPSLLAREVRRGVEDYLKTTFPVTSPLFANMLPGFLEKEDALFRGPFVFMGLPFTPGKSGEEFFPEIPLGFTPYLHQEKAFTRLAYPKCMSTLVSTGTGSGKTECFLWPILDYCLRHRGEPGIKAMLIYPMNALASDQAQRVAKTIHDNESLKGRIRAGLYVGHDPNDELEQPFKAMDRDHVITCRYAMRENPPDILMTNYKMLDFLLLRPADRKLWRHNRPETLKYLVVDELHTFDGAQGTDLACLIRRLKARLDVPEKHLCCVGTSATMGGGEDAPALLNYAERVFGEPFGPDALVSEERMSAAQFLAEDLVLRSEMPKREDETVLDPEEHVSLEDYIKTQAELWLGSEARRAEGESYGSWRLRIGGLLRGHGFFQNFLKVLGGRPRDYHELLQDLGRVAPVLREADDSCRFGTLVLDSLVALISFSRKEEKGRILPLVTVQVQCWLREMRRMVASVGGDPNGIELFFSDDLKSEVLEGALPVVHCRDCGATGWASLEEDEGSVRLGDLRHFYASFFNKNRRVRFFFPSEAGAETRGVKGRTRSICPKCMKLTQTKQEGTCPSCGAAELIPVFVPDSEDERLMKNGSRRVYSNNHCPFCGAKNGLSIVGSRSATLSSVMISQTMASPANDDKKMLAFNDSVQDAAHHAGFYGARTYRFTMRTAMAKFLAEEGEGLSLQEFADRFPEFWKARLTLEEYVASFIAPNQMWRRDYNSLKETGKEPGPLFMECFTKRMSWEVFTEFGLNSRIGRTLEKSSVAVAMPDKALFEKNVELLHEALLNEVPQLEGVTKAQVSSLVAGLMYRLKHRGGLYHPELEFYVKKGGDAYFISTSNKDWMPPYGKWSRRPLFLSTARDGDFDRLYGHGGKGWYYRWLEKCFTEVNPLIMEAAPEIWRVTLNVLSNEEDGLLLKMFTAPKRGELAPVWALKPSVTRVGSKVVQYRCTRCGATFTADEESSEIWDDLPCLKEFCEGSLQRVSQKRDYYGRLYREGDLCRINPAEHTGLLSRGDRTRLENDFKRKKDRKPWDPNILSCTPTLEMGIDIGDLSTLLLCSVPPRVASFFQRVGRAGRRDGNSFSLTVAVGRPHDLYFFSEPLEMISGQVDPPGVFLSASAVLERQFTAFVFDSWIRKGVSPEALPDKVVTVLNQLDANDPNRFPWNFLNYLEMERSSLLKRFVTLFPGELAQETIDHLDAFSASHGEGLQIRLAEGLRRLQKQRKSIQGRARRLKRAIDRASDDPTVKNEEIDEMKREKKGLERLSRDLGEHLLFNFLTDEGLIPNYAFPESGVVLKSLIYRKDEDGNFESDIYRYERAAASALRELAPASHFYAGGRKVRVDQVDMSLSEIEEWRFCDVCSYMEKIGARDSAGRCPRCGSTNFGGVQQKRKLLRMRQVFASASDRASRIGDDSDDRERSFYLDQTLVNFDKKDVERAWRSEGTESPFGYEYISRAILREVNFGLEDDYGERVSIDGKEFPRKGFAICRHCGKLQDERTEQKHTSTCPARNKDSEENLIDCVYLYRELRSEALRILLPLAAATATERDVRSFVAALQLGLKRYFRGGTDHIHCTIYQEPVAGTDLRWTFLLLYDAIPGGTGYLKQLALDENALLDVLENAQQVMVGCTCAKDSEKDGCYRCLYAYGSSYHMKDVSRSRAMEMNAAALQHRGRMVPIDTISRIEVNASFDSELEARFIEALKRKTSAGEIEEMAKYLIKGKAGYHLKTGAESWFLEPQVPLDESDGVRVPCRADFVFWPARQRKGIRPVVIFMDGYAFHKDRLDQDAAQRMALLQSGRFWVWSLTWKDLLPHLGLREDPFDDPLAPSKLPAGTFFLSKTNMIDDNSASFFREAHKKDPFEMLLTFLSQPDETQWRGYAKLRAFMASRPGKSQLEIAEEIRGKWKEELKERLPEWKVDDFLSDSKIPVQLESGCFSFDMAFEAKNSGKIHEHGMDLALSLDDGELLREKGWRAFLKAMNLFQFVEGAFFSVRSGLEKGTYDPLVSAIEEPFVESAEGIQADDAWKEALDLVEDPESLRNLFDELRRAGWEPPVVGFELCDQGSKVLGQAELAWEQQHIALLSEDELSNRGVFEGRNWKVFPLEQVKASGAGSLLNGQESQGRPEK